MPQVVAGAAIAAANALGVTSIAALSTIGAVASAATVVGGSLAVSSLLAPKPRGIGSLGSQRAGTFTIRQPSPARRIPYGETVVAGIFQYAETVGDYLYMTHVLGDGPIESAKEAVYFDGEEIPIETNGNDANGTPIYEPATGNKYEGLIEFVFYTGAAGQLADPTLVAASDSLWTTSHYNEGIAYVMIKGQFWDAEIFPQGVPNITFKIKGRNDILDPRTGLTGYTANAVLCMNHYLTNPLGPNLSQSRSIHEASLINSANIADETVSTLSGTEKRYQIGGYVDLSDNWEDIISDFLLAMAGWRVWINGQIQIIAGAYQPPSFEITRDMITSEIERTSKSRKAKINTINGVYQAEENQFQATDFPTVQNSDYLLEDRQEFSADREYVLVKSPSTVQRLAKADMAISRLVETFKFSCNLKGLQAQAGRTVKLTLPEFGYTQKTFIVDVSQPGPIGRGAQGVHLVLREWDSSIYDWTPATDEKAVSASPDLSVGLPKVDDVTANPAGGAYPSGEYPKEITLTCTTADVEIRWSVEQAPASRSQGTEYLATAKPSVAAGQTLYARAFKTGYNPSNAMSETYTAT